MAVAFCERRHAIHNDGVTTEELAEARLRESIEGNCRHCSGALEEIAHVITGFSDLARGQLEAQEINGEWPRARN